MQTKLIAPVNLDEFSIKDLRFNPPDFSESTLFEFLNDEYGVTGSFKKLAGERDQNFRVTTAKNEQYVLKISGPEEEISLIDFQIKALQYIAIAAPDLAIPRNIANKKNDAFSVLVNDAGVPHAVRLLSYVQGVPVHNCGKLSKLSITKFGAMSGRLCKALEGFEHPASGHFMPWDTLNGLIFSKNLCAHHLPLNLRDECLMQLDRLKKEAFPKILALPTQIIHNDAHTGNVMCDPQNAEVITGIIDFGDMIARPIIVDMAVSLGSLLDQNPNLIETARAFIDGYEKSVKIDDAQLELLFDTILARAIMSVQLLDFRAKNIAGLHDIRDIELPGAIRSLAVLLQANPTEFLSALRYNR